MEIIFRNKRLKDLANNYQECRKKFGESRAKLYNRRLGDLRNADTLEDVRYLPGRYHELTGERKGQWACDLDQPYRLIFEPRERPIPADETGRYIWSGVKGVEVVEIVDYHR